MSNELLDPDRYGRCDECGGEADDHVSDLGCFCRWCDCCGVVLEAHEDDVCAGCWDCDQEEWADDIDTGPLIEDVPNVERAGL